MLSASRIQTAIGARNAATLSHKMGGAAVYVRCSKPSRKQLTDVERSRISELAMQGYYGYEIAALTGLSISSISLYEANRILGHPASVEGRVTRAALREGMSLGEAKKVARVATLASYERYFGKQNDAFRQKWLAR